MTKLYRIVYSEGMATNGNNYDLTEWERYKAREVGRFEERRAASAEVWEQWDNVAVSAQNEEEVPDPPQDPRPEKMQPPAFPDTPPAFERELMPDAPASHQLVMREIEKECHATLTWLKELRRPYENDWRKNRAYYEMAEELRGRDYRQADIELPSELDLDAELDPERMAMLLPVIFEAVQVLVAHDLSTMGATSVNFCELFGTEKNDIEDAVNVMKFLNYQQRKEIQTSHLLHDLAIDARICGTGWVFQDWDFDTNGRKCFVPSPFEVWCDASSTLDNSSVLVLRREMTVKDLYALRDKGSVWFSERDIETAINAHVTDTMVESNMSGNAATIYNARRNSHSVKQDVNPMYRKVYVDIQMDTAPHRWILRVNESLVIAVTKPLIPDVPDLEVKPRFPCAAYTPVRKPRSIMGDAPVTRMRNSQDFSNAMASLLMANVKGSTLGYWTSNDPNTDGNDMSAGEIFGHHTGTDIKQHRIELQAQMIMGIIDWIGTRNSDRISGVTEAFRGQQQFSGQTASSVRDMLGQSNMRTTPQDVFIRDCMQDFYEIAITLNRLYLTPHKYFRIVGEQYAAGDGVAEGREITAGDFIGVSGKDLVPTGFVGGASMEADRAMNSATIVANTGGRPQPIMKQYIRQNFGGQVNPDDVYPENGIGHDPMQENDMIMQGQPVSRDPDDNDQTHVVAHMQLIMDPNFQQVANQNPALMVVLQEHIGVHQQELMQLAAMAGGATPNLGLGGTGYGAMVRGTPQPKQDADREAQMTQLGAPAQ